MGHVGYMDAHLIFIFTTTAERQRVVEVFGIERINRERQRIAHIAAAVDLLRTYIGVDCCSFLLRLGGIIVRQPILCQYGVHLCIVVTAMPEHIDDLSHWRCLACSRTDDFHNHPVAIVCTTKVTRCNGYILIIRLAVSEHLCTVT